MAAISSLGIGSGLDLSSLVDNLLNAERAPKENSLNRRESRLASDLSGVGLMKSALASFQSSLSGLDDAASYKTRTTTNTNTKALAVSSTNDAAVGGYTIDIDTLASSQALASGTFSSVTDTVGSGTIQIRFGTITGPGFTSFAVNGDKSVQNITVDSSNNTLVGLKDHINAGDYGVSAAIVNDGGGYRLTLTSDDTGLENALEINITDSDANHIDSSGLSALAYNASATNLSQTRAAADASISVNGLPITAATNTLSEVIEGVTLTLKEPTTSSLTLNVAESTAQLAGSIRSVVESFNDMLGTLRDLGTSGGGTGPTGLLSGDAALRGFTNALRRQITSPVEGLTGSITALSNIGIRTQANGSLSIDEVTFGKAMAENPTGALALFAPVGRIDDSLIAFNSSTEQSLPGRYAINVTTIATQGLLNGGTRGTNLTIGADNDNMTLLIDGVSTGNLSLTQGVYASAADLASEMQSQINSANALVADGKTVSVNYDSGNNRFVITSDVYGSSSSVKLTAIDIKTTTDFGLIVADGSDGVDVAGSIGGSAATGSGQTLSTSNGLSVDILGGNTGTRGTLEFSRGFVENLNTLLDNYLDSSTGSLVLREEGLNESLTQISDQRAELNRHLESVQQRLVKQFTALDQLLSQFQSTGNFLTQQIQGLPGSGQLLGKK